MKTVFIIPPFFLPERGSLPARTVVESYGLYHLLDNGEWRHERDLADSTWNAWAAAELRDGGLVCA